MICSTLTLTKGNKMSDYKARVMEEHIELKGKIERLEKFLTTDTIESLPQIDRDDLREQHRHMVAYFDVLTRRVSRMCNNA
jgi:hypothetical protein